MRLKAGDLFLVGVEVCVASADQLPRQLDSIGVGHRLVKDAASAQIQRPGMASATATNPDAWLMAVVTVTAVLTMVGVVAADVIYALVDPRIVPGRGFRRIA